MHVDHERVLLGGVIIFGEGQPALHVHSAVSPVEAVSFAPCNLDVAVEDGDLLPDADFARPDFRRRTGGLANDTGCLSIARKRRAGRTVCADKLISNPKRSYVSASRTYSG